ncbi:hypothetical protein Hdeb2414_s0006g00220171 [Helianthus debilis subsp. tardiflorus]
MLLLSCSSRVIHVLAQAHFCHIYSFFFYFAYASRCNLCYRKFVMDGDLTMFQLSGIEQVVVCQKKKLKSFLFFIKYPRI